MTDIERRTAAARFAADWAGRGDGKQETQSFWLALLRQYKDPNDPETLKSLNKLCVRLVFCLYADYTEVKTMPKKSRYSFCRKHSLLKTSA